MFALGDWRCAFLTLPILFSGPVLALAEADGPEFYRPVGVATENVLNMRTGPGTEHSIIGTIPANADGVVNFGCVGGFEFGQWESATAEERAAAQDRRWCRVGYDRIVGWAAGRYLTEGSGPDKFNGGGHLTSLAGSEWQLRDFAGEAIVSEVWVAFKADGAVGGHSGCNRFNGRYAEGGADVEFGPLATTRMACPTPMMEIEAAFSRVLDATRGVVATHLILAFFDPNGLLLATLTRRDAD